VIDPRRWHDSRAPRQEARHAARPPQIVGRAGATRPAAVVGPYD
jgi:hypothetical protein